MKSKTRGKTPAIQPVLAPCQVEPLEPRFVLEGTGLQPPTEFPFGEPLVPVTPDELVFERGTVSSAAPLKTISFAPSVSGEITLQYFLGTTSTASLNLRVFSDDRVLVADSSAVFNFEVERSLSFTVVAGARYDIEVELAATEAIQTSPVSFLLTIGLREVVTDLVPAVADEADVAELSDSGLTFSGVLESIEDFDGYAFRASSDGRVLISGAFDVPDQVSAFTFVAEGSEYLGFLLSGLVAPTSVVVPVTAGERYDLNVGSLANGFVSEDLSRYELSVSYLIDDHSNERDGSNLTVLASGSRSHVTGRLEDATDVDVFAIDSENADLLALRLSTTSFADVTFRVIAVDAADDVVFEQNSTLSGVVRVSVQSDLRYFAEVMLAPGGINSSGALIEYSLDLLQDDVADDFDQARPLELNSNGAGSVRGVIDFPQDVDVYRFVAPTTGDLALSVSGTGTSNSLSDPTVRLFSAEGNQLGFDDDSGPGLNSLLTVSVEAGATYYIQVAAFSSVTGAYELVAEMLDAGNGGAGSPSVTEVTYAATTTLDLPGSIDAPFEADEFVITFAESGTVEFAVISDDGQLDPTLTLRTAEGNLLAFDDDSGPGLDSLLARDVEAGERLHAFVQGFGRTTGNYQLRVSSRVVVPDDVGDTSATALDLGTVPLTGASRELSIGQPGDVDVLRFSVLQPGNYAISLEAIEATASISTLDPVLDLRSQTGLFITDDDGGEGLNSLINQPLEPDAVYELVARGFGASVGNYRLSISFVPPVTDDVPNTTQDAPSISMVAGIGVQDGAIDPSGDVDVFRYQATSNAILTAELTAVPENGFDPLIEFVTDDTTVIASDDDSGEGLNSRLSVTVVAGETYFIRARGFAQSRGRYELRVTEREAVRDLGDSFSLAPTLLFDTEGRLRQTSVTEFGDVLIASRPGPLVTDIAAPTRFGVGAGAALIPDADVISFIAPASGPVSVSVLTIGGNLVPVLSLFEATSEASTSDESSQLVRTTVPTESSGSAEITAIVTSGRRYFARVAGQGSSTGTYALYINSLDDDVTSDFANSVAMSIAVNGSTTNSGAIDFAGDTDLYRITTSGRGALTIELTAVPNSPGRPATLDPLMTVYRQRGAGGIERLARSDDTPGSLDSRLVVQVEIGDNIFVEAAGFGASRGRYQLRSSLTTTMDRVGDIAADAANLSNDGFPLTLGTSVTLRGDLTNAFDTDFYRFSSESSGTATVGLDFVSAISRGDVLIFETPSSASPGDAVQIRQVTTNLSQPSVQVAFPVTTGMTYFVGVQGAAPVDYALQVAVSIQSVSGEDAKPISSQVGDAVAAEFGMSIAEFAADSTDDFFTQSVLAAISEFRAALGDNADPTTEYLVILADPVDFILTDPLGRSVGFTAQQGQVDQIGNTYYSGNGFSEVMILPGARHGEYSLQLTGLGETARVDVMLLSASGMQRSTYRTESVLKDVEVTLELGRQPQALPLPQATPFVVAPTNFEQLFVNGRNSSSLVADDYAQLDPRPDSGFFAVSDQERASEATDIASVASNWLARFTQQVARRWSKVTQRAAGVSGEQADESKEERSGLWESLSSPASFLEHIHQALQMPGTWLDILNTLDGAEAPTAPVPKAETTSVTEEAASPRERITLRDTTQSGESQQTKMEAPAHRLQAERAHQSRWRYGRATTPTPWDTDISLYDNTYPWAEPAQFSSRRARTDENQSDSDT